MSVLREEIALFAIEMEKKMSKRDPERGNDWRYEKIKYFRKRLDDEVDELDDAIKNKTPEEAMDECLDVANFAMMLYWGLNMKAKAVKDGTW